MDWNRVADAGLLNPQPPVGKGMGFVPVKAILRPGKLNTNLVRCGIQGFYLWWKLTRKLDEDEAPNLAPTIRWCGRGPDPRRWPVRLRARWARTRLALWLDCRFGPLAWTRERWEDTPRPANRC